MAEHHSTLRQKLSLIPLILLLASCARVTYFPTGHIQTGLASWYGPGFHGERTSSKEIYDMYDMTAAHPNLPFGTYVMVTNLNNGKSAVVRINDRGPFIKGRVIDLSYAAARMLEMTEEGVVPVKIEVIKEISPKKSSQKYSVQVGAFIFKKNAVSLKRKLQNTYQGVYVSLFKTSHQVYYRVRIKAKSLEQARKIGEKLLQQGYSVLLIENS
ncbi:MAG: septal ring lytic transglycosylase RlpA family protein [Candidatus Aminicenantes bacterium]